ncbi:MAG: hypothetical protein MUP81_01410 [Dehalococcoidia bacterium]|nr:hypothetical protein [Dehalococcoidia bacterium]
MAEYTKGDWKVDYPNVVDTEGWNVCEVSGEPRKERKEAEANAYLIAAAPDMYEALNQAYWLLDFFRDPHRNNEIIKTREQIRQALAKVEGKEDK